MAQQRRYKLPGEILLSTQVRTIERWLLREISKVNYQAAPGIFDPHNKKELVRILLCLQLVEVYGYTLQQLKVEVSVPKSRQRADVVVYSDEARTKPYLVFECNKPGISFAQLSKSVARVINQAKALGAPYAIVLSGVVRKVIRVELCRGAVIPRSAWQEDWPVA